jgi:hypothetical protein
MVSITACRERISDRFPLASFVVKVPPDRYFEIACATDPRLFAAENRERRTSSNFTTSRLTGLLRAPAGQVTYMVPPDQLRRFAGARRLFYAVASYRGTQGQDPIVTLSHDRLDQVPSIQIAPDFTGKSLDRGRLVRDPTVQRYGAAHAAPISWGGDSVVVGPQRLGTASGSAAARKPPPQPYDDGFDAALWNQDEDDDDDDDARAEARAEAREDARDDERYGSRGEPAGCEDAPALRAIGAEPEGIEDGAEVWRRFGGSLPGAERVMGSPPATAARPGGVPLPREPQSAPAPSTWSSPRFGDASGKAQAGVGAATRAMAPAPERLGAPASSVEIADGYEDSPDLVRHLGPAQHRLGAPRRAAPRARALGRFPGYTDDEAAADALPAARPALPAAPAPFDPGDPRQRVRILHRVAVAESGADTYRAVNPDREYEDAELPEFYHRRHVGLSWGFIQFAQRYGSLGQVLSACNRRDPAAFRQTFGNHNGAEPAADPAALAAGHLLRVTNAPVEDDRLAPVSPPAGGTAVVLWEPAWVTAFQAAGAVRAFQEAQREIADRRYYEPYVDFLAWLGFDSVRAQAMFVDRAIHMGGGAAIAWVMTVIGPIQTQSDLAAALERLGVPDVRAFQSSPPAGARRWLVADGVFGPRTHAAMVWALRQIGEPTRVAALDEMLAALCDDAARRADGAGHGDGSKSWQLASQRLRALKDDPALDRLPPEPRNEEPAPR